MPLDVKVNMLIDPGTRDWNSSMVSWDARTRPQGRRTRVRRGGTRGRGRDAADRASLPRRTASCHVARPESGRRGSTRLKSAPIRRKSAPTRPKSVRIGRIGLYRPKRPSQAEIKKKNKRGANAPFYLVISQHSF